jgi:hypothetical protein
LAQATGGHHQVPVPSLARLRRWLWLVAFDLDTVLMLARLRQIVGRRNRSR